MKRSLLPSTLISLLFTQFLRLSHSDFDYVEILNLISSTKKMMDETTTATFNEMLKRKLSREVKKRMNEFKEWKVRDLEVDCSLEEYSSTIAHLPINKLTRRYILHFLSHNLERTKSSFMG
jgi:hypothetical protein